MTRTEADRAMLRDIAETIATHVHAAEKLQQERDLLIRELHGARAASRSQIAADAQLSPARISQIVGPQR